MSRISFLNGQFIDHSQAFVHIEDRGIQFADGVYEVTLLHNNNLIDNDWHLERLFRSLSEIGISITYSQAQITDFCHELFRKNNLANGSVYIQITRGMAPRNQLIPASTNPTVIITVSSFKALSPEELHQGFNAITMTDIRWQRCDIKSIGLLASSLCKQKAHDQGYSEAIFVRDNEITECTFSNLFIVDSIGTLITRPLDNLVLPGVTRKRILQLAAAHKIHVQEEKISLQALMTAQEVFSTSTTMMVRPLTNINGQVIGNGTCGTVSKKLIAAYQDFINQ